MGIQRNLNDAMKKIIIPAVLGALLLIAILYSVFGESNRLTMSVVSESEKYANVCPDSVVLKVYVENSGSMDGYMCGGSELKDAVFDYISDAKKICKRTELNYINTNVIPYKGILDAYIKDLNPKSFAQAGGDRANTDLPRIFQSVLAAHKANTISVFVSDCILDIPEDAKNYFGNCQISFKNMFNDALLRIPTLGVEIVQLESKFEGTWYCGKESEILSNAKRPYYIWIIGDMRLLAKLNRIAPIEEVINGIRNYSAYAPVKSLPCAVNRTDFVINQNDMIDVELLVDLNNTLQRENIIEDCSQYSNKNRDQVKLVSVLPITDSTSVYSHVLHLQISNPKTLREETVVFNYPHLASWVESSNDDTGKNVRENLKKTTGIKYLIKGVAEAYKGYNACGNFGFKLKTK